jgi:hypothetical protein
MSATDPRVDEFIDALPEWQARLCQELRDLIQGNVCAFLAAKNHVNLFLYDGAIVPDPEGIITGGHDNKTARTISPTTGPADGASSKQQAA